MYMRMCHHPRTYPLILVGVAQQRAHVPMCHHDFFRLLGPGSPLSDLGTHNCINKWESHSLFGSQLMGAISIFHE